MQHIAYKDIRGHCTVFELDELRYLLNVGDKKSYKRFNNFRQWVLDPAIEQINDFGTVAVSMTPHKVGRSIVAVRFDWQWKSISDARETDEENERVAMARRKADTVRDMPPLSDDLANNERPQLSVEERAAIAKDALKNTPFAR